MHQGIQEEFRFLGRCHLNHLDLRTLTLVETGGLVIPLAGWIAGTRRAEIIVRTAMELETITVTARSPIATEVSIDIGDGEGRIALAPDVPGSLTIRPGGVYSRRSWAYLMRVTTSDGFVPRLTEPGSQDGRFLGAAISLTAVPAATR